MKRLLWLFLIVTRLRDRLRCPECKAVGTYKLHAPGNGRPWRWLCKWCGYYDGPEGRGLLCCPSPTFGCWIFRSQADGFKGMTPEAALLISAGKERRKYRDENPDAPIPDIHYSPWPWRG